MLTLGVIDLRHGRAVHAVAGARDRYAPVTAVAGRPIPPGDAVALAAGYVERLAVDGLYVADLDAILDAAPRDDRLRTLASVGVPVWYDGGIGTVERARRARAIGAAWVIVALETLPSHEALEAICLAVEEPRVAFGLDLRNGRPIAQPGVAVAGGAEPLIARARHAGVGAIVAIDLARVGTADGPDVALAARVRAAAPNLTVVSGGGVRDRRDLDALATAGCDAVLLATALHDGRLGRDDLAAVRPASR